MSLLATLRMDSGPTEFLLDAITGGVASVLPTLASLKDALTTGGYLEAGGDSVDAGLGAWGVNGSLDSLSMPGIVIDFLRVKMRLRRDDPFGPPGVFTARPVVGSQEYQAQVTPTPLAADFSWDFATHPVTSLAWTEATVNAAVFGWRFEVASDNEDSVTRGFIEEFSVEVWGSLSTPEPPIIVVGRIGKATTELRVGVAKLARHLGLSPLTLAIEGEDMIAELRRTMPRFHTFESLDGRTQQRFNSAGGSFVLVPPCVQVNTPQVSGGLRVVKTLVIEESFGDVALGDGWWGYPYHVRLRLGWAHFSAAANPEIAQVGIGIGHPWDDIGNDPPWPAVVRPPWPDPSPTTWCRLVYKFASGKMELQSTPGDGVTPTAKVEFDCPFPFSLAGGPGDTQPWPNGYIELVYDPFERAVYCIVKGVERARITNLASLPRFDSAGVQVMNYLAHANAFIESGNVNGTSVQMFVSNAVCWNPGMDGPPAVMW